ncbi:hypothetical protein IT575_09650 [bacterium]|nr:hypothetical protein [bacterium]
MVRHLLLCALLLVICLGALACGGRRGGGGGGGSTPPVTPPAGSDDYSDGYLDGYDDGWSARFHDDPWYFDRYRGYNYGSYNSGYYDPWGSSYSSSRSLASHPWDCDCGCRAQDGRIQTETYYESARGSGSPALPAGYGNLPVSGPGADGVLDSLELELLQMQRPLGVSEQLWADLKQAAKEAARAASASGNASRDPGEGGRVTDLTVQPGATADSLRFEWTYRNDGDYDLDGRVRAADMAQVGIWYGRTSADPDWAFAQGADGNGDGRVSIADASVIGMNYGSQVDEYVLCMQYGDWNGDGVVATTDLSVAAMAHGPFFNILWVNMFEGQSVGQMLGGDQLSFHDAFVGFRSLPLSQDVLTAGGSDSKFAVELSRRFGNVAINTEGLHFTVSPNFFGNDGIDSANAAAREKMPPSGLPGTLVQVFD